MFVQATKSRRQNKTYVSYLVRESFRTSEGPRSRTVCNISALPLLTQIPPELNTLLGQLGLLPLFSQPPAWAEA